MKVLAIDPGYGRCGMAVLERESGRDTLLFSSCVETTPKSEFAERLRTVVAECERLIAAHAPDCLAIEKIYFSKSRSTAMRIAEVRGALIAAAAAAALEVFEYAPSEVKSATASFGAADKRAMGAMVRALVKMDDRIRLDDEYDAIAIGITHFAQARSRLTSAR